MRILLILLHLLFLSACQTVPAKDAVTPSLIIDIERAPDQVIPIWTGDPPGGIPDGLNENYVSRENDFGLPDRAHNEITRPILSIFKPENPDGSAILIIPGGGYNYVVVEKEGFESARWFNQHGVTAYVLGYRLPHQGWEAGPDTPLQDAQRAMRVIRSRVDQDNTDPERVAAMGFSAGGHLAGSLVTRFEKQVYTPQDDIDTLSARPNAGILVYPVITLTQPYTHGSTSANMVGADASLELQKAYSVEQSPPDNMPPIFLLHASDDAPVPVENSLMAYEAFKAAGTLTSLHIFESGGHGFGLRGIEDDPLGEWPYLVLDWGQSHGIF